MITTKLPYNLKFMEIKKIQLLLFCLMSIAIFSCSKKHALDNPPANVTDTNLIRLSAGQVEMAGIKTGYIKKHLISDIIYCSGSIEADPNEQAYVSAPMNGYMKQISVYIGDYVRKGQNLAMLEHPNYIELQKEYLETKSQYDYYKEDFKRQGELSLENATSLKKMQMAQNEFRKVEASFYALKEHLEFIGIDTDSLYVDKIKSSILLRSPISGYITKVNGKIGQLCTPEMPVFEIIENKNALLHLKVFEMDADKVRKGQSIEFNAINDPTKTYQAIIRATTRSVDENNTINLHAMIIDADKSLLPGMYVKAKILVDTDSVFALINQAIVEYNNSYFIFEKLDGTAFKLHEITTGRTSDILTEIEPVNSDVLDAEIVISGAYYLQSRLQEE